jgi:hypothetical protein
MMFKSKLFAVIPVALVAVFSLQVFSADAENEKKESTKASEQSFPNEVNGEWVSEWGPVKFSTDKSGTVSGSWEEGKNKIGKISAGKFDSATGALAYDFIETWTGLKGKATMKLSASHKQLAGTWVRGKDKGTWTMHRPDKSAAKSDSK